jgi:hypothetical protein
MGEFSNPQITMEHRWNTTDGVNPKDSEKTCPGGALSITSPTRTSLRANPIHRGEQLATSSSAMARPQNLRHLKKKLVFLGSGSSTPRCFDHTPNQSKPSPLWKLVITQLVNKLHFLECEYLLQCSRKPSNETYSEETACSPQLHNFII